MSNFIHVQSDFSYSARRVGLTKISIVEGCHKILTDTVGIHRILNITVVMNAEHVFNLQQIHLVILSYQFNSFFLFSLQ